MSKIGVIGAGIAGCATAIELANSGHEVSLFESTDQILGQSSDASSNCFGVGFYLQDITAAKISLETCIRLLRYLKEQTGKTFQVRHAAAATSSDANRIHYVITDPSRVDNILSTFASLRSHYEKLVEEEQENAVLGDVASFYQICDITQFADLLDINKVSMVIETCDSLFDWQALKSYLISYMAAHPKITIHLNSKIKTIQHPAVVGNSIQTSLVDENKQKYNFDNVVNAAWRNTVRLNQTAGFYESSSTRVDNQIAAIAIIRLPEILYHHSFFMSDHLIFFTSGPDGVGTLTYSPVSYKARLASNTAQIVEDRLIETMAENADQLGHRIIAGAAQYIPALEQSTLLNVKIGVIRASEPSMMQRYKGVHSPSLGLIVNEARQHTFWKENAREVSRVIDRQTQTKLIVMRLSYLVIENLPAELHKSSLFITLLAHFSALYANHEPEALNQTFTAGLKHFSLFCERKFFLNREIESYAGECLTNRKGLCNHSH